MTDTCVNNLLASLTLVSTSPQREQLLREAGYRFAIAPPRLHEPQAQREHSTPAQLAEALAFFKVSSVADELPDRLLLGADTVVATGTAIFGKPADRDDARRMLRTLTSTPHQVITGVALLAPAIHHRLIAHAVTELVMQPMSPAQLEAYLDTGVWQGKAGGYGLQTGGDPLVTRIDGSFSNVIGLPLELLARMLEQFKG